MNNRKCIIEKTEKGERSIDIRVYDIDFCDFEVKKTKHIKEKEGDISIDVQFYDLTKTPYYIERKIDGNTSDYYYLIQSITPNFFKKKITLSDLEKLYLYKDKYLYIDLKGIHALYELSEGEKAKLIHIFDLKDKKFVNFKTIRKYVHALNSH